VEIQLANIGKRFGKTWIFKEINHTFRIGVPCALVGANGSGKSTLLKIISGGLTPTFGSVKFLQQQNEIYWADAAQKVSFAAPYMDLIEYLTLEEHVDFHFKFKSFRKNMTKESLIAAIEMQNHTQKLIKDFSSGMKQRLKLALALFTESPIILLDEPTANLDAAWSKWYRNEIEMLMDHHIIVIASNQKYEYEFCQEIIEVEQFQ
jgi:ABC-type multidrug transport system ATPase subunit